MRFYCIYYMFQSQSTVVIDYTLTTESITHKIHVAQKNVIIRRKVVGN